MGRLHRRLRGLWLMVLLGTAAAVLVTAVDPVVVMAKRKKKKAKKRKRSGKKAAAKKAAPRPEEEAKPEAPAEEEEVKREEIRTTGPAKLKTPVTLKSFDNSAKAQAKRDDQIDSIKQVLVTMNDAVTRADLVFRLAELYWDSSRYYFAGEMLAYDGVITKWIQNGSRGAEPVPNHKKSDVFKRQALDNYRVILEKYPDYPRRDEVLYIMAQNTYEAGKKDKAVQHYWELIKQYPKSEYVGDAYLAMGEHFFNANDVLKAQKAYKKALETRKRKVYSYALYKLAWCDYNLQEWDGAIKKFKAVVDLTNKERAKKQKTDIRDTIQLKSEALNDLTLTFTHVEAIDDAYDYLKKEAGDKKARRLTAKMATLYMDQGKYDAAVQTYRLLINQYPDDPDCPDFQSSIVAAFFKLNKRGEIRTEVRRLVDLYRPGTPWWKKNQANPKVTARARETAEERMRELVTDTHQIYTKIKKKDDAELARDMYSDYLKVFPDSEHAYRLRFFYAEILWDLGNWTVAAEQYDATVENDKANAYKGEYTRQAAYNAILAYEKIAKGEAGEFRSGDSKGPKQSGKKIKRKEQQGSGFDVKLKQLSEAEKRSKNKLAEAPIPETELKLAAACDRYVTVVPANERTSKDMTDELVLVKFKAGAIYQKYYHFAEAAKRFEDLIDRWPTHEFARLGAELVLDSWDYRENWAELNRVGRKFQKNKTLMAEKSFAAKVDKFVEGSSFKEILVLNDAAKELKDAHKDQEAATQWADCATRFLGFQKEFPKSQFADKAVYNATVIYDRADKLDLAIAAAELLVKDYKKSDLVEQSVLFLGSFHERIADFRNAAEYYETYVKKYGKTEKAPDALYNAAVFYQGLGERKKAIALYDKYMKDYKKQNDIAQVYWKVARMYDEDEDYRVAGAMYADFEKKFPKEPLERQLESRYNYMQTLLHDRKKESEVKNQCDDLIKRVGKLKTADAKLPVAQRAAAHCRFMQLEPRFEEFMAIKLELPMKKLKSNLEAKAIKLAQLKDEYTAVLGYGDGAWGVAALYKVALIHYDFAKALKDSPDPPGLDPDQLSIYRSELEGQTFPVDDKAIQALEAGLAKAFELGIYTEWTARCQDLFKVYKPNEFPPVHDMPFYYSDISTGANATSAAKETH